MVLQRRGDIENSLWSKHINAQCTYMMTIWTLNINKTCKLGVLCTQLLVSPLVNYHPVAMFTLQHLAPGRANISMCFDPSQTWHWQGDLPSREPSRPNCRGGGRLSVFNHLWCTRLLHCLHTVWTSLNLIYLCIVTETVSPLTPLL